MGLMVDKLTCKLPFYFIHQGSTKAFIQECTYCQTARSSNQNDHCPFPPVKILEKKGFKNFILKHPSNSFHLFRNCMTLTKHCDKNFHILLPEIKILKVIYQRYLEIEILHTYFVDFLLLKPTERHFSQYTNYFLKTNPSSNKGLCINYVFSKSSIFDPLTLLIVFFTKQSLLSKSTLKPCYCFDSVKQ